MKELRVDNEWRTIQIFIAPEIIGLYEVQLLGSTKETRCNCPVFEKRQTCKHDRFVRRRMDSNAGHYAISVPEHVTEAETLKAAETPESFRAFVVKYGRVEVI